jgi:hypothetical protein
MSDGILLFDISALTMVCIRLGVWYIPEVDIKVFRATIHHFWFGVILCVLSYPISAVSHIPGILVLGCGLGLAADELVFMLRGAGRDKQYWQMPSVLGSIAVLLLIFYFQSTLVHVLY